MVYVAIADDHVLVRQGIKSLIDAFGGYKVIIETDNGMQLVEAINRSEIEPDICLVDINMPVMNGYQTLSYLHVNKPKIKLLALSMYVNEHSIVRMFKSGALGYLPKDSSMAELRQALDEIHKNGFFFWDGVKAKLKSDAIGLQAQISEIALSQHEQEYLDLCCENISNSEIAKRMNKSIRTIEDYKNSLFKKFGLNSRLALAIFALKSGLVTSNGDEHSNGAVERRPL